MAESKITETRHKKGPLKGKPVNISESITTPATFEGGPLDGQTWAMIETPDFLPVPHDIVHEYDKDERDGKVIYTYRERQA